MSSWSASVYPPPPRRSRSRSPGFRGGAPVSGIPAGGGGPYFGRGGYPEAGHDVYRADWEAYERDQAWASYERDRVAYDYRRRSRSPVDDVGRKRRRSTSPYGRERYDPRPRYEDYDPHRGYGYSPPRTRGGRSGRPPPDPHTFEYPASLRQFADWFRYYFPQESADEDAADKAAEQEAGDGSKPRNGIKTRWEKYKKTFFANQLQTMFDQHRKSVWFVEKYDPSPEYVAMRARVRKEGLKGRIDAFLNDLEAGAFDGPLTEDAPPDAPATATATAHEPVKEEANAMKIDSEGDAVNSTAENGIEGTDKEREKEKEKEEAATKEEGKQDEDFGDGDDEGGGDKNGLDEDGRTRGGFKRGGPDEVSVPIDGNQIMIRTIPPDIGRLKLEAAIDSIPGFQYLALGEPLQKRNFYRAGWVKFDDGADMSHAVSDLTDKKIEGFKLHVTHIVREFTNRMRKAPEVASRPERLRKDLANVRTLAAIMEKEAADLRHKRFASKKKNFRDGESHRPGESASKPNGEVEDGSGVEGQNGNVAGGGTGVETADDAMGVEVEETGDPDEPDPREVGSVAVERRAEQVMNEWLEGEGAGSEQKAIDAKRTIVTLDLFLNYLRSAFHCCYYCVVVTNHREELQRKCVKHVRKPMSKLLLEEEREKEEREKEAEKAKVKEETADADLTDEQREDVNMDGAEEPAKGAEEVAKAKASGATENRDWKRNDERWLEWLDNKVALLLNRSNVNVRDYGGKREEDEMVRAVEPHIKQEDEGKFRCKNCQKLFKATAFVEKHVANKHPELIKGLDDIPFFNNFALDPHHIQPFSHPSQAAGQQQGSHNAGHGNYQDRRSNSYPGPPMPYHGDPRMDAGWGAGGDPYAYGGGYPGYGGPPPREDRSGRRLSDRLGGFAEDPLMMPPPSAGLPAKPPPSEGGDRRRGGGRERGPPPPPPPDAKQDPRAAADRRVSYHDMDLVAEGDVELSY